MKKPMIAAMPADMDAAHRLAAETGYPLSEITIHAFPDGESLVRAGRAADVVIIYCTLDHPNAKLIELGLAASAYRDLRARRLVLVAPYLCYMRQDKAFHEGEAVAQRFIGGLLAQWFDRVITVEPHLHRIKSLDEVMPGIETDALSSAGVLAQMIVADQDADEAVLVGPDAESRAWTEAVANETGSSFIVLEKTRHSDRKVELSMPQDANIAGKRVCLVDDVVSTGETLAAAARLLKSKGAGPVQAVVTHALFSCEDEKNMKQAGIEHVRSTDCVAHATNAAHIAPLLAAALRKEASL